MVSPDGDSDGSSLERVRTRYGYVVAGANSFGALVVFLFLMFVLPLPSGVRYSATAVILNAVAFVLFALLALPTVWRLSARRWRATLLWAEEGREPSDRERELTLRFPLSQQRLTAMVWVVGTVAFTALNVPFSLEIAGNVLIGSLLGGLASGALGYLLGERVMRPVFALSLTSGAPARPQLPGVAARTLLSWTLGPGIVLLALALVGIGALHEKRFTAERLAIVVIVLSVVGMLVGFAMVVALARSLADPIAGLRRAVAGVAEGKLDEPVAVDDGSEVGLLQAGFNQMLVGLREREHIRDLFGRQVGEDVVRHALERGVELGGETRDAAVLFVDLEGSTALAEERDPAEVVSLLNAFFSDVVEVVAGHHGWVNKFEGDAALCVFGAPLPDPQAATHALAAARALRARLERSLGDLRAGIGVSAGRVVAGNIGAARRFEYTVIGNPVNEAARLSELAKREPGRVLASAAALACADPEEAAAWRVHDELVLRGRSQPTRVAAPLAVKPEPEPEPRSPAREPA